MRKLFVALIAVVLLCFIVPLGFAADIPVCTSGGIHAMDALHVTAATPGYTPERVTAAAAVIPNYAQILALDSFRVNLAASTAARLHYGYGDANVSARKNARGSVTAATQRTRAVQA